MRTVCALGLLVVLSACAKKVPGETLGTFAVSGELKKNTCGPGSVPAEDPLLFEAEIREDRGLRYWRSGESGYVSGNTHSDGSTEFVSGQEVPVYPAMEVIDEFTGEIFVVPGCAIRQVETVKITLTPVLPDGGSEDGGADGGEGTDVGDGGVDVDYALTGTDVILFSPTQGSDCRRALAANGGTFLEFPCKLNYTLTGREVGR